MFQFASKQIGTNRMRKTDLDVFETHTFLLVWFYNESKCLVELFITERTDSDFQPNFYIIQMSECS